MTALYRNVCNVLAVELMNTCESNSTNDCSWSVGHYLAEAHSTTFRHSCLLNSVRKLRLVIVTADLTKCCCWPVPNCEPVLLCTIVC